MQWGRYLAQWEELGDASGPAVKTLGLASSMVCNFLDRPPSGFQGTDPVHHNVLKLPSVEEEYENVTLGLVLFDLAITPS